MGQQQLLLIVLVTIVVGIATVVAIQIFGEAANSAVVDAAMRDLIEIGVEAQGYYIRPVQMGGGGRSFSDLDFTELSLPVDIDEGSNNVASNLNAIYTISDKSDREFLVTAELKDENNRFIAIRICERDSHLGVIGYEEAPPPPPCN